MLDSQTIQHISPIWSHCKHCDTRPDGYHIVCGLSLIWWHFPNVETSLLFEESILDARVLRKRQNLIEDGYERTMLYRIISL